MFCRYRAHGIEPELVPGVSSALAAPLLSNIPLTMRRVADQFLITTAHGRGGSWPELPPFSPQRTCVFLMGVGRLAELAARLVGSMGYPADLQAAVVEKASMPEQRVVHGQLTTIAAVAAAAKITAPAIFIVGRVCDALGPDAALNAADDEDDD